MPFILALHVLLSLQLIAVIYLSYKLAHMGTEPINACFFAILAKIYCYHLVTLGSNGLNAYYNLDTFFL